MHLSEKYGLVASCYNIVGHVNTVRDMKQVYVRTTCACMCVRDRLHVCAHVGARVCVLAGACACEAAHVYLCARAYRMRVRLHVRAGVRAGVRARIMHV